MKCAVPEYDLSDRLHMKCAAPEEHAQGRHLVLRIITCDHEMNVRLVGKSETCLAATRQCRVCPLSIWPAGCETGFTSADEAEVNPRARALRP